MVALSTATNFTQRRGLERVERVVVGLVAFAARSSSGAVGRPFEVSERVAAPAERDHTNVNDTMSRATRTATWMSRAERARAGRAVCMRTSFNRWLAMRRTPWRLAWP